MINIKKSLLSLLLTTFSFLILISINPAFASNDAVRKFSTYRPEFASAQKIFEEKGYDAVYLVPTLTKNLDDGIKRITLIKDFTDIFHQMQKGLSSEEIVDLDCKNKLYREISTMWYSKRYLQGSGEMESQGRLMWFDYEGVWGMKEACYYFKKHGG